MKYTKLSLAVVGVLLISALFGASSASALTIKGEPPQFSSVAKEFNDALSSKLFSGAGIVAECGNPKAKSELRAPSTILAAAPEFSECTLAGWHAKIRMNGCFFVYELGTQTPAPETPYVGFPQIRCWEGYNGPMEIEAKYFTSTVCTVSIPVHQGIGEDELIPFTGVVYAYPKGRSNLEYTVSLGEGYPAEYCAASGTYNDGHLLNSEAGLGA